MRRLARRDGPTSGVSKADLQGDHEAANQEVFGSWLLVSVADPGRCRPRGSWWQRGRPVSGESGDREALGRSRGGLSTKLHLAADRRCRPVSRPLTAGQRHDSVRFAMVMDGIRVRRRVGRPRTRPGRLLADKAYTNKKIRAELRRRRITAVIPEKKDQVAARAAKGSRGGGAHPPSTVSCTNSATSSSGRSTSSSSSDPWPPATTRESSCTRLRLTSPR
ncbi:transposase [Micromonospora sp. CPCC 205546]|uniref:transposase n=1 Tax=Micromonospora sp. CPCC 205546 TaxID=3122397 RepID=UPI003FA53879